MRFLFQFGDMTQNFQLGDWGIAVSGMCMAATRIRTGAKDLSIVIKPARRFYMKTKKTALTAACMILMPIIGGTDACAVTRTWVSGVGDDANPCSRTAPCKTFAGAISKTDAGGEISVLDPGGFGAITITKAVTINGAGTLASILAAGTNGIVVNAGANDVITIRNISINGGTTGLNGIRFLAGKALHVENVDIFQFSQKGIDFEPTTNASLFVQDSVVRNCTVAGGGGVLIKPGTGVSAAASFDRVEFKQNNYGLRVEDRSQVSVRDSVSSGNTNNGFLVFTAAAAANLNMENTVAANNGGSNPASAGIKSEGGFSTARISNVSAWGNSSGLLSATGGNIVSFGNNRIDGNGVNGSPTQTVLQQ
jgi:hypothetical protein